MHDICSRCGVEANLSPGNYSDNALAALIVWGEMSPEQIEGGVCDLCHQETREVLMERTDELSSGEFRSQVADLPESQFQSFAAVGGEPIYSLTRALSSGDRGGAVPQPSYVAPQRTVVSKMTPRQRDRFPAKPRPNSGSGAKKSYSEPELASEKSAEKVESSPKSFEASKKASPKQDSAFMKKTPKNSQVSAVSLLTKSKEPKKVSTVVKKLAKKKPTFVNKVLKKLKKITKKVTKKPQTKTVKKIAKKIVKKTSVVKKTVKKTAENSGKKILKKTSPKKKVPLKKTAKKAVVKKKLKVAKKAVKTRSRG